MTDIVTALTWAANNARSVASNYSSSVVDTRKKEQLLDYSKTLRDLAAILGHKQHTQTVSYLEHLRQYVTEDGRFIAA